MNGADVDIDAIIPYERNARHNEKAIPIVAESIKEFGLRGQIVLEGRDNPVIVAGHTRWAACKALGWTEIPDDKIDYCDDLTSEQIMAYRLADNRTGEVATWNKTLLKSEVRKLESSGIDMGRFNFDFKSKIKPYGAERFRTDDAYNLGIIDAGDCAGPYDMPMLEPCDVIPDELMPFNYAKSAKRRDCWLHFFIDDYQFERLWGNPEKYLPMMREYEGALTPDYSLYMDMPLPMQQWNEYRRRALGSYWQRNSVNVIPTLSWTDSRSYGFCFEGLPKHAIYATSTVGVKNDELAMKTWHEGMAEAVRVLEPKTIILYGGNVEFEFPCEVIEFKANTAFRER